MVAPKQRLQCLKTHLATRLWNRAHDEDVGNTRLAVSNVPRRVINQHEDGLGHV